MKPGKSMIPSAPPNGATAMTDDNLLAATKQLDAATIAVVRQYGYVNAMGALVSLYVTYARRRGDQIDSAAHIAKAIPALLGGTVKIAH